MKRIVQMVLVFAAGFMTYGFLDRLLCARAASEFRANRTRCQLVLAEYGKHRSGTVSNLPGPCRYTRILLESDTPASVAVACAPEYHDGKGANMLFADGAVEWITPERLKQLTALTEKSHRGHVPTTDK
jgi:prepilin-type processing-associated H-X9-DG protein